MYVIICKFKKDVAFIQQIKTKIESHKLICCAVAHGTVRYISLECTDS